jgi:hypothetical protein
MVAFVDKQVDGRRRLASFSDATFPSKPIPPKCSIVFQHSLGPTIRGFARQGTAMGKRRCSLRLERKKGQRKTTTLYVAVTVGSYFCAYDSRLSCQGSLLSGKHTQLQTAPAGVSPCVTVTAVVNGRMSFSAPHRPCRKRQKAKKSKKEYQMSSLGFNLNRDPHEVIISKSSRRQAVVRYKMDKKYTCLSGRNIFGT